MEKILKDGEECMERYYTIVVYTTNEDVQFTSFPNFKIWSSLFIENDHFHGLGNKK